MKFDGSGWDFSDMERTDTGSAEFHSVACVFMEVARRIIYIQLTRHRTSIEIDEFV